MSDLLALAERCEAATAEQEAYLLSEAWARIYGKVPQTNRGGDNPENRFCAMLRAKAYESAAIALIPEGWGIMVEATRAVGPQVCLIHYSEQMGGRGKTIALAICAAALRVRAQ